MKEWRRKFQQEWMTTDHKPKKKVKRAIEGANRVAAKKEIRKTLKEEV